MDHKKYYIGKAYQVPMESFRKYLEEKVYERPLFIETEDHYNWEIGIPQTGGEFIIESHSDSLEIISKAMGTKIIHSFINYQNLVYFVSEGPAPMEFEDYHIADAYEMAVNDFETLLQDKIYKETVCIATDDYASWTPCTYYTSTYLKSHDRKECLSQVGNLLAIKIHDSYIQKGVVFLVEERAPATSH